VKASAPRDRSRAVRDNGAVTRLLVLGAGPAQLGVLAAARARDLTVVAADRDPSAPGFSYADRRAIVSIEDEPAIERLARAEDVNGIIAPGSDHAVAVAARVAERLALPLPVPPEVATLAVNKLKQRERLTAAAIAQPRSLVCRTLAEVADAAAELGYPVVIEAPDRAGERSVALSSDREALAAAAAEALADAHGDYCLVEELVPGPTVTVNAFSVGGRFVPLTVTDRELAPPPAFGVTLAHVWPAELEPAAIAGAIAIAGAAARALGVVDGPTTTQVLIPDEGPPLLAKVSARVGGGHDGELCRVALGVDANALAVAVALGEEVRAQDLAPSRGVGAACVRFLVAPAGVLHEVRAVDEAFAIDGVRGIRIYRKPGHVFRELRRASDRAGAVLVTGDTRDDALDAADEAAERIRFVTRAVEAVA
jgi:biotin carboxylase